MEKSYTTFYEFCLEIKSSNLKNEGHGITLTLEQWTWNGMNWQQDFL
jgi:hypothetical protein